MSRLDGWETIAFFFYIVAFPETSRAGSAARWAASREGRGGCSGICRKIDTATLVCFGPVGKSAPRAVTKNNRRPARCASQMFYSRVLFALTFRRRAAISWLVNICRLELLHRVVKNGGFAAATRHSSYGIQRVRRSVSWHWTIFPRPLSAFHGRPSHPGSQSLFEHRVAGSSETTRGNASTCSRPAAEFGRNSDAPLNIIQRRNPLTKFTLFLPYGSASATCRYASPPLKSPGNALFSLGKWGYF